MRSTWDAPESMPLDHIIATGSAADMDCKAHSKRRPREILLFVLGAWLLATVLRVFLFQTFAIPSVSMTPTLLQGDLVVIEKVAYGPRLPHTSLRVPGYGAPKPSDVIVFDLAMPKMSHPSVATLVKRIVGVAGDTIYMRDGLLFVNGQPAPQPSNWNSNPRYGETESTTEFGWQHSIEVNESRFGRAPAQITHDNWGPLVIPAHSYFVLGDNRYESRDSRYWGAVPESSIIGRAAVVLFSIDEGRGIVSSSPRPRWDRIGRLIR